jgi:hypothetical protein
MAAAIWRSTLGTAMGTGVLAGAGQLGVAYGLGILRWDTDFASTAWHWQLTWLVLFAAIAVITGAAAGRWRAARPGKPAGLPVRLAVTLTAALGAAIMIPLVLHPAHAAHVSEPGSPGLTAVIATGAGLVLGVVAAVVVLSVPAVAGNVVVTATWLWLAALGSAVWTIGRGGAWGAARPGLGPASGAWIPLLLLGVPALIALVVAAVARFGGSPRSHVAVSGAAGPALLAIAYVVGAPGGGAQTTSYRYALLSVAVAVVISIVIAMARRPVRRPRSHRPVDDRGIAEPAPARFGAHRLLPAPIETPDHPQWPGPAEPEETTQPLPAPTGTPGSAHSTPGPAHGTSDQAESKPEPAHGKAEPAHNRPEPGPAGPARGTATPPATGAGTPSGPARGTASLPKTEALTAQPDRAATVVAPEQTASPPSGAPVQTTGRRGRRRGQDAAAPPVRLGDSDYVDWLKTLGGDATTGGKGEG